MARFIHNDAVVADTGVLYLSIDTNLGILSTTVSGSMSSYAAQTVGSYSTGTTLTTQNNYVLVNAAVTITLPTNPPNGTTYVFRNTTTGNPTLSRGGLNMIRNVADATATATIQFVANGTYMFTYYNNTWYGI